MKKSAKFIAIIMVALIALTSVPFAVLASTDKADSVVNGGTAIYDAADFLAISAGGTYYLANDIDFGGESYQTVVSGFSNGIIDGRGHTLKNFSLSCTATGQAALIGSASSGGTVIIKNLNIGTPDNKIQMTLQGNSTSKQINAGFVVGINSSNGDWNNKLLIENVNVYGDVTITSGNKSEVRCGGFVGYARNVSVINCTMNGSMTSEYKSSKGIKLGGIIGTFPKKAYVGHGNLIDGCVNNADITEVSTGSYSTAGGIVGLSEQSAIITNCTNNGNMSSKKAAGIVAYQKTCSAFIANCNNTGTMTGTDKADIYAYTSDMTSYGNYIYVKNCTPADQNTAATAVSTLSELQAMTDGGIYYLANDLDLNGAEFENCVVDEFGGVLDGNGKSIYNFSIKNNGDSDIGFFGGISYKDGSNKMSLITDLTLGSAASPAKITSSANGKAVGALTPSAGTYSSNDYSVVFDNVEVYAEIEFTGASGNVGGFAGSCAMATYKDCNFYGKIEASGTATENASLSVNVGGFVGTVNGIRSGFYGCNNFGTVTNKTASTAGNDALRAAGMIGHTTYHPVLSECANFGEITARESEGFENVLAAGLIAETSNTTVVGIFCCSNFGTVTSGKNAAALISSVRSAMVYNFVNYGTVTGKTASGDCIDGDTTDDYGMKGLDCVNESAVNMIHGAAVKLDAPTGLRFCAMVNEKAFERLTAVLGENGYSAAYGTIIAPRAYVNSAAAFTHTEMDAFGSVADIGDSEPYVDVKIGNNEWFGGKEGQIAGAVVNLARELYEIDFCARAYMTVNVNGYTFNMYADNPQTRNISSVAKSALADVLYLKDGEYFIFDGENYVKYEGTDIADYSEAVETVGEYTKVSPYNADERVLLLGFADPNAVPDEPEDTDAPTDTDDEETGFVPSPPTNDVVGVGIITVAVIASFAFACVMAVICVKKKKDKI